MEESEIKIIAKHMKLQEKAIISMANQLRELLDFYTFRLNDQREPDVEDVEIFDGVG